MPRVKGSSTARCTAHGTDCATGGGSRYRSSFCARVEPGMLDHPSAASSDEPDTELLACLAEQRAEVEGIPLADAVAAQAHEVEAGRRAWNAMRPERRCAGRDAEPGELAAMLAETRARALARS